MSVALGQLSLQLATMIGQASAPIGDGCAQMENTLAEMRARGEAVGGKPPQDRLLEAIKKFWDTQKFDSFRDAYLVSWGLTQAPTSTSHSLMEDGTRFGKALKGVDDWKGQPRYYRRCYQGLMSNYFGYDGLSPAMPSQGRKNWKELREYLRGNNINILQPKEALRPEWVTLARKNRKLFGENPCEDYVEDALNGDLQNINHLCDALWIGEHTWFQHELILGQIRHAASLRDGQFISLLPRLLDLLQSREVLRDQGLALILDRYARIEAHPLHSRLRDDAVSWWKNPWLPSNAMQWGSVRSDTKSMVSEWLKGVLIEAFFNQLAQDGAANQRRTKFWKRYIGAISEMEFALGANARSSRDRDFLALLKKMEGLTRHLDAPGANNAFIMRMGTLVIVEFSNSGNACYAYDERQSMPFDTSMPLQLEVNGRNSLKNQNNIIKLRHADGNHGWTWWEDMFEATLQGHFDIQPDTNRSSGRGEQPHPRPTLAEGTFPQQYSLQALKQLATLRGLGVLDNTTNGGALWVTGTAITSDTQRVLTRWGFSYRDGRGWWKQ